MGKGLTLAALAPRKRRFEWFESEDWCGVTVGASGKPTSFSIQEFKETPEYGMVKELAEKGWHKEFLFWFPCNDNQELNSH